MSSTPDPVVAARARSYELADTGDHADWDGIVNALRREQVAELVIRHLGYDKLFLRFIAARIEAAREKQGSCDAPENWEALRS